MKKTLFVVAVFCLLFGGRCLPVQAADRSDLSLKMKGIYECARGDILDFSVVIANEGDGVAKDVQAECQALPEGFAMLGNATSSGGSGVQLQKKENGWYLECSQLDIGTHIVVAYQCKAEKDCTAGEHLTCITATAKNARKPLECRRDIWVNEPQVKQEVQVSRKKWKKGEEVVCQILVEDRVADTMGKDITVTTDLLPKGLSAKEESAVDILGIYDEVLYPQADGKPGFTGKTVKNPYSVDQVNGSWRVNIAYLPWDRPVIVRVECVAEKDGSYKAGKGGDYAMLTVEQEMINPNLAKNDGRRTEEFRVGEIVKYQVTVNNINSLVAGENLVLEVRLPEGVDHIEFEEQVPKGDSSRATEDNKIHMTLPRLAASDSFTFRYQCSITERGNGQELENNVTVHCDNARTARISTVIWVNSPQLEISLMDETGECVIGETVKNRIAISLKNQGCRANDVIIQMTPQDQGMHLLADSVELTDQYGEALECEAQVIGDNLFINSACDLGKRADLEEMRLTYDFVIDNEMFHGKQFLYSITVNSRENLPVVFQRYLNCRS